MALNDIASGAVNKKIVLMERNPMRFGVRSIFGGAFLTLGTAFAGVVGNAVESAVPGHGLGAVVFAMLFGLGLFCIVILNAELATGNMMMGAYGAAAGQISWPKALWFALVTTFWNLVGAILIAAILGVSAKYNSFDATNLVATLSSGKLDKSWWGAMVEAIAANFVVNMAIVAALFAKDFVSKFFVILPIIAIFVGLGLEHVIANFSLMTITAFAGGFDASLLPDNFTAGAVALNWLFVWIGNYIGGGLLIGAVYAWLNSGDEAYRD
ncbi:formate/nitrite transporter family protein [Corynebacterium tapiri]|uniref:Formate/nitrite transporter family protein n=1 Tax=Corynebacterium tapiri TaxID=1448266 RepID=A0A5C4U5B5_9CORY|nr:formate/nitrite transporter family protein [Corynebacterium tapiri]TNL98545.1 formate/nitrite transporter family protein [Corynebacterium tapiri]